MNRKIIRVFPRRTRFLPNDDLVFFDRPGLFIPEHDEVHVVAVFTWDIPKAQELFLDWQAATSKPVRIGGPAFDDPGGEFTPGLYLRQGITITSRGCPNQCKWCFVPGREGKIREIEIKVGNIIQDNNILATSREHQRKVIDMLRGQAKVQFKGGLEVSRLTPWFIEEIRSLRIDELWLACDTAAAIVPVEKAIKTLRTAGFTSEHIRCYVLIGDDMSENLDRLERLYRAGASPFAQLFQASERICYSSEWKKISRLWTRPGFYRPVMKAKGVFVDG